MTPDPALLTQWLRAAVETHARRLGKDSKIPEVNHHGTMEIVEVAGFRLDERVVNGETQLILETRCGDYPPEPPGTRNIDNDFRRTFTRRVSSETEEGIADAVATGLGDCAAADFEAALRAAQAKQARESDEGQIGPG